MGRIINIVEILSLKFWNMLYNKTNCGVANFNDFWYKHIVPKIIIIGRDYDGKYIGIIKIKHKEAEDRLVVYMTKKLKKEKYVYNSIYSEATGNI